MGPGHPAVCLNRGSQPPGGVLELIPAKPRDVGPIPTRSPRSVLLLILHTDQLTVDPGATHQRVVIPDIDDLPLIQHDDPVGVTNRRQPMCDEEDRTLTSQRFDRGP